MVSDSFASASWEETEVEVWLLFAFLKYLSQP